MPQRAIHAASIMPAGPAPTMRLEVVLAKAEQQGAKETHTSHVDSEASDILKNSKMATAVVLRFGVGAR